MIHLKNRAVIKISGSDAKNFLQGLITNDINKLSKTHAVYAAMLTPQGKYLFDFLLYDADEALLIDINSSRATELIKKLNMYKLRSKVEIAATDLAVFYDEEKGIKDPRHPKLGRRLITPTSSASEGNFDDYQKLCRQLGIPDENILIPEKSYILKHDFEKLNGVDFNKGCYVGQEVTARMKFKNISG